jgi:acetylornithine deacetylase/succinyl-diaminopimelate desuccinylase-like protein
MERYNTVSDPSTIYRRPAELLQNLIRLDTTNPPGNEIVCIDYIDGLLDAVGIETRVFALDENRPNLIARLSGRGDAPPLLLYGHVDVVTTEGQDWQHPPFAAEIADGYIWGRGALDMKGGVAMMLSAFMRAHAEGLDLPGDVVLALVSDEEDMGAYGAGYLVREHAALFEGIRYAVGEFGGFTMHMGGRRFYPIMIAEKQTCGLRATLRGPAGHGSIPMRGGAVARLADFLCRLDRGRLPVHVTPAARLMIESMSRALPFPQGLVLRQLLNPPLTDRVLDLLGGQGRTLDPLLHNTVNATIIRGGDKVNVIPAEITVDLDGRLLPGFTPDDMLRELRALVGDEVELEVVEYDPGPSEPDMGLFDTLAAILRECDPDGIPTPLLLSAVTDARFFSRLGIQTYGFLPMQLPEDFDFVSTLHAADERIPVAAVEFGANAIYALLRRFGNGAKK